MVVRTKQLFFFTLGAIFFWLVQFWYQLYALTGGEVGASLVRSFAFSGATLLGLSLFSSAVFKWFPRLAQYWRIRRYLGVSGFIFILFHVLSAYQFLFHFDLAAVYFSLNPLENPIIFGSIAFIILFVMAVTSSDWAVQKLGPKRWKFIHRFVYLAFLSAIFHFITINPQQLKNIAGYVLLLVTASALFGQIFWFFKIASRQRFRSFGSLVGIGLMMLAIILGYVVYQQTFAP